MLLAIDDNKTVSDLQEKFNECFPHLKIEFYTDAHGWREASPKAHKISPRKKISQISNKHVHDVLEIKSWYKTGKVEHDFKRFFGLNIQILRLKNGKWIQTTDTDTLTLEE